jgi:hypothetical protein
MKPMLAIGLLFLVLGVVGLIYLGMNGALTHDTLVKAGPVAVEVEHQRPVPVVPILAVISTVGGAALLVIGISRRRSV